MTTSTAVEVERRRPRAATRRATTPFGDLALVAGDVWRSSERVDPWDANVARYRKDPCAFAEEILAVPRTSEAGQPWTPLLLWDRQREILEAIRDHHRVATSSGHKIGKSTTAVVAALWFFCCFEDARVMFTAVKAWQVDEVLWRELRRLVAGAKLRGTWREEWGDPHELARSGLKSKDHREIVGFTAKDAEAVAGISGAQVLYIADEASGIGDALFQAMAGNLAGGGRMMMFSNPTRTDGTFFDAFNSKSRFFRTFKVASTETPNAKTGEAVIPGLATRAWIDEQREEWGEDSPFFKVRVLGEFVLGEDGKIIPFAALADAEERWDDAVAEGRLHIGVDPAGAGVGGDESAFAIRRGKKVLQVVTFRGLTEAAHVAHLVGFLTVHRKSREEPALVKVDPDGEVGWKVYRAIKAYSEDHASELEVVGVRGGDKGRQPQNYFRVRDELWANLAAWVRDGGALPSDVKLAKELHTPEWVPIGVAGCVKVTAKSDMRAVLGRSPDRADAVALAVWERPTWARDAAQSRGESRAMPGPVEPMRSGMDPYGGMSPWSGR